MAEKNENPELAELAELKQLVARQSENAAKELAELKKSVATQDASKELAQIKQVVNAQIEMMQKQNSTIENLTRAVETVSKENAALQAKIKQTDPAKPKQPLKLPEKTFRSDDGREFKFVVKAFRYKGHPMTAVDAMTDKALLAELVEKKSGLIREVKK